MSSRLSSVSGRYDSSREWAFLRSLGLDETQQEVAFPMFSAAGTGQAIERGWTQAG